MILNEKKLIYKLTFSFLIGIFFGILLIYIFDFFKFEKEIGEGQALIQSSYNEAIAKASPAVVNIYSDQLINRRSINSSRRFDSIFGNRKKQVKTSLGSGVLFSSDGYILTNQHVIGDVNLKVTVELSDGRKLKANIIGIDRGTDLAVLKINSSKEIYPSIEIEDSNKVKIGDVVLAIGNPYGIGQSVSMGIISATGREFDNPYSNYLQTDASINKGNSGGALIDINGRLIGINTLIRTSSGGSEGIGLAIPSSNAIDIISDLIQYGEVRRGWLGFSIDQQNLLRHGRLVVTQVIDQSPSNKAGLLPEDLILSINGSVSSYENLFKTFARSKPGDKILLEVMREEQILSIEITSGQSN
ncbi:MAG: 2-alkenal reductase [Gammaproteobacteria bacterium]|nr:2-alkenal reductase [Gammaproteobacteria bacterium]HJL96336.1 trypsin-like peptidase domain-containing protein [SAR86 cluster bacterium]|tara:strand:- start:18126 stop:19199 length:1074 start_codon:yes stop_codon:yes gene_type:complete